MREIDGEVYISEKEFERAVKVVTAKEMDECVEKTGDMTTAMIMGMSGMIFAGDLRKVLFKGELDEDGE